MMIHDLNIVGIATSPSKTDAPLIVDSNTVLSYTITDEFLKSIRWRNSKIFCRACCIQHQELPQCNALNCAKPPGPEPLKNPLGFLAAEALDHHLIVTPCDTIVKRYQV